MSIRNFTRIPLKHFTIFSTHSVRAYNNFHWVKIKDITYFLMGTCSRVVGGTLQYADPRAQGPPRFPSLRGQPIGTRPDWPDTLVGHR